MADADAPRAPPPNKTYHIHFGEQAVIAPLSSGDLLYLGVKNASDDTQKVS